MRQRDYRPVISLGTVARWPGGSFFQIRIWACTFHPILLVERANGINDSALPGIVGADQQNVVEQVY